jgi:hypothetical protein
MRKIVIPVIVTLVLAVGGCGKSGTASGPGSAPGRNSSTTAAAAPTSGGEPTVACPTSNTIAFAKTKFVTHTGEAFGVFHRYLYKPYRAGTFAGNSSKSRVLAFAKAGLAALFIKRQVRLATEDVKANPTLCRSIAAPLASIGDSITTAVDKLKSGDASGLTAANSAIAMVESRAGRAGDAVTEDPNAKIG